MEILRVRRGVWLVLMRVGLYRLSFGHRYWPERPSEDWDAAFFFLWFYVSRRLERRDDERSRPVRRTTAPAEGKNR
jgi:hypothetical protein